MNVQIINKSKHLIPSYETVLSAGMDLRASIDQTVILQPLARCLIKTGLFLAIPSGYEAQIRPRSGMALKKGITVLNTPGTIDSDYRGEIGVILINLSNENCEISNGDRIAQMIIAKHEQLNLIEVEEINTTDRGDGGFGSTGFK